MKFQIQLKQVVWMHTYPTTSAEIAFEIIAT